MSIFRAKGLMYLQSRQRSVCLCSPMLKPVPLHHIANRSVHFPYFPIPLYFLTLAPVYNLSSTETSYCITRALC